MVIRFSTPLIDDVTKLGMLDTIFEGYEEMLDNEFVGVILEIGLIGWL
jgi:hypothetical protein